MSLLSLPTPEQLPSTATLRIGVLGGSFNPAHRAHLAISDYAIRTFKLACIWWLVSPHNPLKAASELKPYPERLALARAGCAGVPGLVATDLEQQLGTRYTVDTMQALKTRWPKVEWLWLMGADNLVHFHHWKDWQTLFRLLPIAVLRRPPYTQLIGTCPANIMFGGQQLPMTEVDTLFERPPPVWVLADNDEIDLSATEIRAGSKSAWPLKAN